MNLTDLSIKDFSAELESASPAPGGGSVAALCGTLAAALCKMVTHLTMDKGKYEASQPQMEIVLGETEQLSQIFTTLIDDDTKAFIKVVKAYKMPKTSPGDIEARNAAIQTALKKAAEVPFDTIEHAAKAIDLVRAAAEYGNPNCITDAGVAGELCLTAVRGAAYNVYINLKDINDPDFVSQMKAETRSALKMTEKQITAIRKKVSEQIELEI